MSVFVTFSMEKHEKPQSWYQKYNLDYSKIGNEGCRFLSRAQWKDMGYLDLCIKIIIKIAIKLKHKVANYYPLVSGVGCKSLT